MTDEATNLVLEHLRRFREEVRASHATLLEKVTDVELRLSGLEQTVGQLHLAVALNQASIGQIQISMGSNRSLGSQSRWRAREARAFE